jgi:hypothetical protein
MKAPLSQRSGKKMPKKNIHPCPFLSVLKPRKKSSNKYKKTPPIPIPHQWFLLLADCLVGRARMWLLLGCEASSGKGDPLSKEPGFHLKRMTFSGH